MTMSGLLPIQLVTKMDVLLSLKVWEQSVATTLVLRSQSNQRLICQVKWAFDSIEAML